jgi:hypothetical protein
MKMDKKEIIDWLRLEVEFILKRGYYPSVREPRKEPRFFRDSVTCPNMGLEEKLEPCSHCFLMQFVPSKYQNEEYPCHYVPLNAAGETIASLERDGRRADVPMVLVAWLKHTIGQLEHELALEKSAASVKS